MYVRALHNISEIKLPLGISDREVSDLLKTHICKIQYNNKGEVTGSIFYRYVSGSVNTIVITLLLGTEVDCLFDMLEAINVDYLRFDLELGDENNTMSYLSNRGWMGSLIEDSEFVDMRYYQC